MAFFDAKIEHGAAENEADAETGLMMFLSGTFWPIESMPELFRKESIRLEHEPSNWRGYFLCSAFTGVRSSFIGYSIHLVYLINLSFEALM